MANEATAGVYLGERRVGTLGRRNGNTWFDYEDVEPDHPVLGQGFEASPSRRRTRSGGAPEWFANLLPEPGSGLRELVGRELGVRNIRDFPLLCYLGEDLPGAVRVARETGAPDAEDPPEGESGGHDHPLRFSLAGVQPKFSMEHDGKGLTLPASGRGGNWIVKLPGRSYPHIPENEYTMLTWARAAGVDVPDVELVTGRDLHRLPRGLMKDDELALAIKRFDRTDDGRIHQEDFAQVREVLPTAKYDGTTYTGLGRVIAALAPEDLDEYVRRLVAIVVMGNEDAHLKNWTLRYPDGRTPRLSPAYDLVCITVYPDLDRGLAFKLSGSRDPGVIGVQHFRKLGQDLNVDAEHVAEVAEEMATRLAGTWEGVRASCPVPDFVREHIDMRLRTLPLVSH